MDDGCDEDFGGPPDNNEPDDFYDDEGEGFGGNNKGGPPSGWGPWRGGGRGGGFRGGPPPRFMRGGHHRGGFRPPPGMRGGRGGFGPNGFGPRGGPPRGPPPHGWGGPDHNNFGPPGGGPPGPRMGGPPPRHWGGGGPRWDGPPHQDDGDFDNGPPLGRGPPGGMGPPPGGMGPPPGGMGPPPGGMGPPPGGMGPPLGGMGPPPGGMGPPQQSFEKDGAKETVDDIDLSGEVWVETMSGDSGKSYFYNARTRETTWTRPEEKDGVRVLTQEQVNQLTNKAAAANDSGEAKNGPGDGYGQTQPPPAAGQQPPPFGMPPPGFMQGGPPGFMPPPGFPPPQWAPNQGPPPGFPPPPWATMPPPQVEVCDWSEHVAPDGKKYYYNSKSGESVWEKPKELTEFEQRMQAKAANPPQPVPSITAPPKTQQNETNGAGDENASSEQKESNGSSAEKPKAIVVPTTVEKPKVQDKSRPVSSTQVHGTPWCVVWTGDNRSFFYNPSTKTSVWERPPDLVGRADVTEMLKSPAAAEKMKAKNAPGGGGGTADKKADSESEDDELSNVPPAKKKKVELVFEDELRAKEEGANANSAGLKSTINAGKDSAMEAEVKAARERQLVPLETRMAQFRDLLTEKQISAFSTWEKELHKIVFDPRYLLLTSKERKQVFDKYVRERAEEERREKKNRLKECKNNFLALLAEANLNVRSTYNDFASKYNKEDRYKAVEKSRERESLFNEFMIDVKRKDKEERAARREQAKKEFVSMLKEAAEEGSEVELDRHARWADVKKKLEADPRYKAVESGSSREDYFLDFVQDLKDEHRKRKREKKDSEVRRSRSRSRRRSRSPKEKKKSKEDKKKSSKKDKRDRSRSRDRDDDHRREKRDKDKKSKRAEKNDHEKEEGEMSEEEDEEDRHGKRSRRRSRSEDGKQQRDRRRSEAESPPKANTANSSKSGGNESPPGAEQGEIDDEDGKGKKVVDYDDDDEDKEDERERREREERIAASLRKREEEVARELSGHLHAREKEREQHRRSEAMDAFQALLTDLIKQPDFTWKEAKKVFKKDSRYDFVSSNLEKSDRERLFDEHIDMLVAKKKENYRKLLDECKAITLDTVFKDIKKLIRDDPRYSRYSSSDRKCEKQFNEYMRDRISLAKASFRQLLMETKFITDKSLQLARDKETGHLEEIEDILRKDKRYLDLDGLRDERKTILFAFLEEREKRGPPPPPTATEPGRRGGPP